MRRGPGSIRARLTLWLALLIAGCMAAFAGATYLALGAALTADLQHTLRIQARQVAAGFDFGGQDGGGDSTGQHVDFSGVDQFATAGVFVETFDRRGRLLARSSNLGRLRLPDEARAATLLREPARFTTQPAPGGGLEVYSMPVLQAGRPAGLVLVAASRHTIAATIRDTLALLGGAALVALLAAVGGGVIVRQGLRPLDALATEADGMTARRLDRRLDLQGQPAETRRVSAAFNAMLDRLHAAFAAQQRFVADASHELRTPLATIHGECEVLLLNGALDGGTREGLRMARDEAARMSRLVANLLLLARGNEGRAIDRRPVELDVLLLEVAQQMRSRARAHRLILGDEEPAVALGDADLLKQALLNLVDNALAYTPAGGTIELAIRVEGQEAHLAVRDTGPGIAPEDLERIFERFYRLDQARSRRAGGAGLGLAIARWIAQAHGGRVEARSVVGAGSTFTLVLPLATPAP